MKKIYKNIVFVFPLLLLCVIMIFASFYDLQISQTLADLNFGQYYSQNLFGRFFEIVGETPVYFLSSFSFCIFTMYFIKKNNKKTLNILLVILFAFISTFLNFICNSSNSHNCIKS